MKKFKLFIENSLYTDPTEKTTLLKDEEKVLDAAIINFFGFISLFSLRNTGAFKQYDATEGRLIVDKIGDDNHDVSLALKLAFDAGVLPKVNVDKMTRLLSLIKQKKIASGKDLSPELVRDLYADIKFTNIKPSTQVYAICNQFKGGTLGLSDLASEFYQLAKKKEYKAITGEFRNLVLKGQYTELFKKKKDGSATIPKVLPVKNVVPAIAKIKLQDYDFFTLLLHTKTESDFNKVLLDYNVTEPDYHALNGWIIDILKTVKLIDVIDSYLLTYLKKQKSPSLLTTSLDYYISYTFENITSILLELLNNKDFDRFITIFSNKEIKVFIETTKIPTSTISKDCRSIFNAFFSDVYLEYIDNKGELSKGEINNLRTDYILFINIFSKLTGYAKSNNIESGMYYNGYNYLNSKTGLSYALIYLLTIADGEYFSHILDYNTESRTLKGVIEQSFGDSSLVDTDVPYDIQLKKTEFDKATTEIKTLFLTLQSVGYGTIFDNSDTDAMYQLELKNIFIDRQFFSNRWIDKLYVIDNFSQDEFRKQFLVFIKDNPSVDIAYVVLSPRLASLDSKTLDIAYICMVECLKLGLFEKYYINLIQAIGSEKRLEQRFYDLICDYIKKVGLSKIADDIDRCIFSCENTQVLQTIANQLTSEKIVISNLSAISTLVGKGEIYYLPANKDIAMNLFNGFFKKLYDLSFIAIQDFEDDFMYKYRKFLIDNFPAIKLDIINGIESSTNPVFYNNVDYPITYLNDSEITTKILDNIRLNLKNYNYRSVLFSNMQYCSKKIYDILIEYESKVLSNTNLVDFSDADPLPALLAKQDNINEYLEGKDTDLLIVKIKSANSYHFPLTQISNNLKMNYSSYSDENLIKLITLMCSAIGDPKYSQILDGIIGLIGTLYSSGNITLIEKIFNTLPIKDSYGYDSDFKGEVARQLFQEVQLNGILETMFSDDSLIKPYDRPDSAKIKDVLKFNDIKIKGKTFKGITEFSELNKAIVSVKKKPLDLKPLGVSEIPHTEVSLARKTVDFNQYASEAKHGDIAINVLREFDVSLPEQQAGIKAFIDAHDNTEIKDSVFHGTGSIAASMILRYGFVILPKKSGGVTGRMLGDGVYFTTVLDKASQYVNDSGFIAGKSGRLNGITGYIFQMEAAMGDLGIDYQDANTTSVVSPEWCVLNEKQQLRIYKCFEIEVINKKQLAQIKIQYGLNEKYMKDFNRYLLENTTPKYKYNSTYCFADGMIPVSDGKTVEVDKFKPSKFGSHVRKERSQYGWQIVIQHNNSIIADEFYRIKYASELMDSPTDLKAYFNLLNKK